jgi:hypothetical protein
LINTLLIEYVETHDELLTAIQKERGKQCAKPTPVQEPHCNEVNKLKTDCRINVQESFGFYTFINRATSKCDFLRFQLFQTLLFLSGYQTTLGFEVGREKSNVEKRGSGNITITNVLPDGKSSGTVKETPKQVVKFGRPDVERTFRGLEAKFKTEARRKKEKQKQPIEFVLRSPKSLLTFLGELIALQNFSPDRYVPEVMVASPHEQNRVVGRMTIFRVLRGGTADVVPIVSIRGPDGELYAVPRPTYGDYKRDQTLRVLGITSELVNGAISEKDFPTPTSVIVRSLQ